MIFKTFEDLGKYFGLKPRKPQTEWAESQQKKFLKCPRCKNQLTFIEGTNLLVCRNEIQDGEKKKKCGYRKLLTDNSVNYAKYIFSK